MIILGIDPGTAKTGFGVIKSRKPFKCLGYGLIQTDPSWNAPNRLKKLNNELSKLIKKYQPAVLAIENLYFFKNLKTVMSVSQAVGVILLTAAKNNVPVCGFTPLQVKMTITGYGWSEKEIVQKKIIKLLNLKDAPKSDDSADALAIALTYCIRGES